MFQYLKAYAKTSIQYIPVIGWCCKLSEYLFLDRNYAKDKEKIISRVHDYIEYPEPIWVSSF